MSYGQSTRGFSGRTTGRSSKPVETGKEYTVDITDNGSAGDGIARIQGFIIFVKNTKAGDKNVKIKISSLKDRFATAEIGSRFNRYDLGFIYIAKHRRFLLFGDILKSYSI